MSAMAEGEHIEVQQAVEDRPVDTLLTRDVLAHLATQLAGLGLHVQRAVSHEPCLS